MAKRVLNVADVELRPWGHETDPSAPERFGARLGAIATVIGARQLGYGLVVVPPGKSAWPRHAHAVNEEMFFVIEGEGELRIGDERSSIREGDVIACPPGGPETAHQITNTGPRDLRYLAVSTMSGAELVHYPDSKKIGMLARVPQADGSTNVVRVITRDGDTPIGYWQDE